MASAAPSDFNFEELVTPAELKMLGAKEKGIFFTQEVTGEGEKKNSKDKKKICVSNKRLYILNTQGKTPKLDLSLSLLAISALNSSSPDNITLVYSLDPHSDKTRQVKLEVKPELCVDSLAAILSPLHSSLGRVAVMKRLKVKIQGEGRLEKMDTIVDENVSRVTQDSQVCGISELYALLCDYLDIPFYDEIAWDLENTYHTHSIGTLSLNDFSHFSTRDLVPLIRALEFSPHFEGLHADGIKLCPESTEAILGVSKHCASLRQLTLRAIPTLSYRQTQKLFSQGFAANPHCVLETIDLTDTAVEDKGVEAIATAVQGFPAGPRELRLSGTGFSSKGFAALSKNLLKHPETCTTLRVLDLSGNHFSSSSSDLQTFLSLLAANNRVQELSLSATNVPFEQLFTALHKGCLSQLSSLDLSGNSKPAVGKSQSKSGAVKQFLESASSLKRLNLSSCRLQPDLLLQVLESLKMNSNLSQLQLNLAQNDLSSCFKQAAELVSEMSCLSSLDISQTCLENNYSDVIIPILRNRSLQSLDLSGNMKRGKQAAAKALEESLSDKDCSLHSLKLKDCRLGDHMNFVLRALIRNGSLKQLDVSSNLMGQPSFRQLSKLISNNCSLDSILYDDNSQSVGCISDLASALENNFSLCEMPIPYKDMPRLRKEGDKELETALSKLSRLLSRNQSPLKREHALAVIRKRVQLFLAEQQLLLDKKIVQLDEQVQQYDRSQLDDSKKVVLDRATNLAGKAGLVTMLCENLYTDKLESETSSQLSGLVSSLCDQSLAPEVRQLREKLVTDMMDKLEFSFGNVVSKEKLGKIRANVSDLQQPSFLTEELLTIFSGGLATSVNVGNLGLAEQLIAQTCELMSGELDAMYQQVCRLETAETPKSPDRVPSGGTCRMKLAFSQSMKRHRVSYQTFNPECEPDREFEDLQDLEREGDVPEDTEVPASTNFEVPLSLQVPDTPPIDSEDPVPDSGTTKSSLRSKFRGISKKIKSGTKVTRTGSTSSNTSVKAEIIPVPDLTVFEDLSSAASQAPELSVLKSKPRGPVRRPPNREHREAATETPPTDIFTEIAATVVPGLDQEATPVPDEPSPSATEGPESKRENLMIEHPEETGIDEFEKKHPPPTSPRKVPSGQTTPGAGNLGLASILAAGLGKARVRASKSHENLLAAAEKEELEQKKSVDILSEKMSQPLPTRPTPRPRPMSVFKPMQLLVDPAKEKSEELKIPPIATKRQAAESKPTIPEVPKEKAVVVSSSEEPRAEQVEVKEGVDRAEKKEEDEAGNLSLVKVVNSGVDGEIKKSPSVSRKPIPVLPKLKDKPVDLKSKGEGEVKRPPVAGNRPKPGAVKPMRPPQASAKPKINPESPEKVAVENKNASASDLAEKTKISELGEEKEKIVEKNPDSLDSSSEQVSPPATQAAVESSDTSTTTSDPFEDASDKLPYTDMRSVSLSSPKKPMYPLKQVPLTPTKPRKLSFGQSGSSEDGAEVTSPKLRSPLPSHVSSPKLISPVHSSPKRNPAKKKSTSEAEENAEKNSQESNENLAESEAKLEPVTKPRPSESWVVISDDDEGGKAESTGNNDEITSSDT